MESVMYNLLKMSKDRTEEAEKSYTNVKDELD